MNKWKEENTENKQKSDRDTLPCELTYCRILLLMYLSCCKSSVGSLEPRWTCSFSRDCRRHISRDLLISIESITIVLTSWHSLPGHGKKKKKKKKLSHSMNISVQWCATSLQSALPLFKLLPYGHLLVSEPYINITVKQCMHLHAKAPMWSYFLDHWTCLISVYTKSQSDLDSTASAPFTFYSFRPCLYS